MLDRRPYSEAPEAVKKLYEELSENGDYLVYEDEQHHPIISIAPLLDKAKERRREGARQLNALLDLLPANPYSEEETNALIEEAIEATKGQYPSDGSTKATA